MSSDKWTWAVILSEITYGTSQIIKQLTEIHWNLLRNQYIYCIIYEKCFVWMEIFHLFREMILFPCTNWVLKFTWKKSWLNSNEEQCRNTHPHFAIFFLENGNNLFHLILFFCFLFASIYNDRGKLRLQLWTELWMRHLWNLQNSLSLKL